MLYLTIHVVCAIIFIITVPFFIAQSNKDDSDAIPQVILLGTIFGPLSVLILILSGLTQLPMLFKKKPKPIVPGTYNGYVWGEVVMVGDEKGIVIGSGFEKVHVLWINSSDSRYVDISEVKSTTKPSELAEELAMLDQANKLLSKADAIVKEAGEIKMRAVKKRTNLIYSPK